MYKIYLKKKIYIYIKNLHAYFLWVGLNCLKPVKLLLQFTFNCLVPKWLLTTDPWIGNPASISKYLLQKNLVHCHIYKPSNKNRK